MPRNISSYSQKEINGFLKKLCFPPSIELNFLAYYDEKTLPFIRWGVLFGSILYIAHVFTDIHSFPNLVREAMMIRLSLGSIGFLIFVCTFFNFFKRYIQLASLVTLLLASSGIIVMTFIGTGIYTHLYHSGVMLVLVALFAFLRLKFRFVVFGGAVVILIYFLPHALMFHTDAGILSHNVSNMAGIIAIGIFISYFHEYYIRQGYIQSLLLDEYNNMLSIRNKIIESELEHARSIQQKYLPVTKPTENIFAFYKPMDKVGGDFFHFIQFKDRNRIGIFISDVSGHGMPAAMIVSMLRIVISRAGDIYNNPAALLGHINETLHGVIGNNFITCQYGILDMNMVSFTYANAGHCAPLFISNDVVRQAPLVKTVPLAVYNNDYLQTLKKMFVNQTEKIPHGSKLLMFTDGLSEATRNNEKMEMFESHGLSEAIKEYQALRPEGFVRGIYGRLCEFRGSEKFDDDICIICAEV